MLTTEERVDRLEVLIVAYLTRQSIYAVGMGDETMPVLNLEQLAAGRPS